MLLRLSRNLDKERGFCNGAIGVVTIVLESRPPVFVVKLSHGSLVVVHPIRDEKGIPFLPCTYGYAMTTRKAQGASMDTAALYFDLHCPAPRGFAYVGASRVRTRAGLYYYGKVRRSDWLPVGGPGKPAEQVERSYESDDTEKDSDGGSYRDEASSADPSDDDEDYGEMWLGDPSEDEEEECYVGDSLSRSAEEHRAMVAALYMFFCQSYNF